MQYREQSRADKFHRSLMCCPRAASSSVPVVADALAVSRCKHLVDLRHLWDLVMDVVVIAWMSRLEWFLFSHGPACGHFDAFTRGVVAWLGRKFTKKA